jgi:hypothetical protein
LSKLWNEYMRLRSIPWRAARSVTPCIPH